MKEKIKQGLAALAFGAVLGINSLVAKAELPEILDVKHPLSYNVYHPDTDEKHNVKKVDNYEGTIEDTRNYQLIKSRRIISKY